jgi:hypothetical protein
MGGLWLKSQDDQKHYDENDQRNDHLARVLILSNSHNAPPPSARVRGWIRSQCPQSLELHRKFIEKLCELAHKRFVRTAQLSA